MFGPDLDIHSRHFIRWGWFRLLWIPYQKTIRHRSIWSHGLIVGTVLRLLYLSMWLGIFVSLGAGVAYWGWGVRVNWFQWGTLTVQGAYNYWGQVLALGLGLELGAISHVMADTIGSQIGRYRKHRLKKLTRRAIAPQKPQKPYKKSKNDPFS